MAIKDYYPASRPTLDLNFAGSRIVDPRITFSRSGTGSISSYFDEKGVMKFAPSNVPRIDFDPVTGECKGLLIEEQRTNTFTYSQDAQTSWSIKSNVTVTSDSTTAPDDTQTADMLVENTANNTHYFERSITLAANAPVSYSVYVKSNGRSYILLEVYANGYADSIVGAYNLNTSVTSTSNRGTATGATATIQAVGKGWFRLLLSGTPSTSAATDCKPRISLVNGSTIYTGDGVSGIYAWGAQLESGSFATSYIPTTTAQVTRAADSASLTGANFSSWYKQDEGTLFAEWATTTAIAPGNLGVFSVSDGTANDRIQIRRNAGSYFVSFIAVDGGIMQYSDVSLPFSGNAKSALAYKTNDFIGASNGSLGVAATSGTLPTVSQADIGFGTGISQLNGHIKRIAYYPRRLSDAQLQALTA